MHEWFKQSYEKVLKANANDMHTLSKSEYLAGFYDACSVMSDSLIDLEDAILENVK